MTSDLPVGAMLDLRALRASGPTITGGILHAPPHVDGQTARAWETDAGTDTVLDVSDTGLGMDEETRTRAFEPFFTTNGKRGGE